MLTRMVWSACALFGAFLSFGAGSQDPSGVAYKFLQRHGVPCLSVLKVGTPYDLPEVATCEDGREWALFWLENEIGFVDPQTREAYRWDRQVYLLYPNLYSRPRSNEHFQAVSDVR